MSRNSKQTSHKVATLASRVLRDDNSSAVQRSLAASALAQSSGQKETGAEMEVRASQVLRSPKYAEETKELAASVLAQSNKTR
jgi:hypothetical protein